MRKKDFIDMSSDYTPKMMEPGFIRTKVVEPDHVTLSEVISYMLSDIIPV